MNWISKQIVRTETVKCDIIIKKVTGKKEVTNTIRFYSKCYTKITGNGYIVVAVNNGRLYFKESEPWCGWKLSDSGKESKFFRLNENSVSLQENGIQEGMYNLQFDADERLYYIDSRNRLEQKFDWKGK